MRIVMALAGALLAGCASRQELAGMDPVDLCIYHSTWGGAAVREELAARALWPAAELERALAGQVWVGMPEELLVCSRGIARDVNRSVGAWGIHKQYVYGELGSLLEPLRLVYVENGVVTGWQD